jgi:hypothetical protein
MCSLPFVCDHIKKLFRENLLIHCTRLYFWICPRLGLFCIFTDYNKESLIEIRLSIKASVTVDYGPGVCTGVRMDVDGSTVIPSRRANSIVYLSC